MANSGYGNLGCIIRVKPVLIADSIHFSTLMSRFSTVLGLQCPACIRAEYDDWHTPIGYVPLMIQILVEREERVKFVWGQFQEFAVALDAPSHAPDCRNIASNEQVP